MPSGTGNSRLCNDANKHIGQVKKIHGANTDYKVVAGDGVNMFYNEPSMIEQTVVTGKKKKV